MQKKNVDVTLYGWKPVSDATVVLILSRQNLGADWLLSFHPGSLKPTGKTLPIVGCQNGRG